MDKKIKKQEPSPEDDKDFPGYPHYPRKEDIYEQEDRVPPNDENKESMDAGLDVPGSELDDENEAIREEDEENNYYSLGGDEHNDLEESKDD
ncbi:hypothetical protein [Agriterribacter sp.]|uniref:hypothetical protein n=1 Tax=Agriterribacter sp. TaxID=2821509 RepID=UPI002BC65FFB|nr:hypothetical protein [Agriterribacter sp.]HRO46981.1 hypothetical protein [Agriterribacter sp.]HRQ18455.1 hypothetical protein [Agriterribacter sp.]